MLVGQHAGHQGGEQRHEIEQSSCLCRAFLDKPAGEQVNQAVDAGQKQSVDELDDGHAAGDAQNDGFPQDKTGLICPAVKISVMLKAKISDSCFLLLPDTAWQNRIPAVSVRQKQQSRARGC